MSLDERLPELLERRADQAAVRPTMTGVQARLTARRRHRHRVAAGIAAVVLVLAGVAAVLVAQPADDPSVHGTVDAPVVDVPLLGIVTPGWTLVSAEPEVDDTDLVLAFDSAVFRAQVDDGIGPMVLVLASPAGGTFGDGSRPPGCETCEGLPTVDLGHGIEGTVTRDGTGRSVSWEAADGQSVTVGSLDVEEATLVAYARTLAAGPVDVATIPPPQGFPEGSRATFPVPDVAFRRTTWQNDDTTLTVETTNQPHWLELLQASTLEDNADRAIATDNPSGPGNAMAWLTTPTHYEAAWTTPGGVAVHLTAEGSQADIVEDLLASGALVAIDTPTTTTEPAPTSTAAGQRGG